MTILVLIIIIAVAVMIEGGVSYNKKQANSLQRDPNLDYRKTNTTLEEILMCEEWEKFERSTPRPSAEECRNKEEAIYSEVIEMVKNLGYDAPGIPYRYWKTEGWTRCKYAKERYFNNDFDSEATKIRKQMVIQLSDDKENISPKTKEGREEFWRRVYGDDFLHMEFPYDFFSMRRNEDVYWRLELMKKPGTYVLGPRGEAQIIKIRHEYVKGRYKFYYVLRTQSGDEYELSEYTKLTYITKGPVV